MADFFSWLKGALSPGGVTDIAAATVAEIETAAGGSVVSCLRAEKVFVKKPSSFAGETSFKNIAVVTGNRIAVFKESSRAEVCGFSLATVTACSPVSDSGKPALFAEFSDGSQIRLVFSSDDPAIDGFREAVVSPAASVANGGVCQKCGKAVKEEDRFCSACGERVS